MNVVDTTAPTIVLSGSMGNSFNHEAGSVYSDDGATATDLNNATVTVVVSGEVDITKVGSNILTYSATDSAGNTATATRTVNVVDTSVPAISI